MEHAIGAQLPEPGRGRQAPDDVRTKDVSIWPKQLIATDNAGFAGQESF